MRRKRGCYSQLLKELADEDPPSYKNWLRMDQGTFNSLVCLLEPSIRRQDTVMRDAVPVGERLAITLRYLATGHTFTSLEYAFRVSRHSISRIVVETCKACTIPYNQTSSKCQPQKRSGITSPQDLGSDGISHTALVPWTESTKKYSHHQIQGRIISITRVSIPSCLWP